MDLDRLLALRRLGSGSPRARLVVFGLTAVFFAVVFVWSVRSLPEVDGGLAIAPLVLLAVPTYVVVLGLMAAQYVVAARAGGLRVGWRAAAPVAILSTAANLLPLPGAVLMRAGAMQRAGVSAGRSVGAAAVVGISRLGGAGVVAGVTLAAAGRGGAALVAFGVGVAAFAAFAIAVGRLAAPADRRAVLVGGGLLGVVMAVASGAALWLATAALRQTVELDQAMAIAASGAVADAVGIVPGGLGLREVLAAGIAEATGSVGSLGSVATIIVRVVATVMLAVAALVVAVGTRGGEGAGPEGRDVDGDAP